MFDIGKEMIEFECPQCRKKLKATLNDVSSGKSIYCSSCKTKIHTSADASAKRSVDSINKSLKNLEKTIKKISCR